MIRRTLEKRLAALEETLKPKGYSILEIAETLWLEDRARYIEMALDHGQMRHWLEFFTEERIDWAALQASRSR